MRILDLNNSYSPDGGGIRVYHEEKLAYYRRRNDHHYALMIPSSRRSVTRTGRSSTYELPSIPVPGTSSRFVVRPGLINSVIDSFEPDLIEIGSVYLLPLYLRFLLRRRRVATVGFFHQDYAESYVRVPASRISRSLGNWLGLVAERHALWVYGDATAAFGASEFSIRRLREIGVRRLFKTPLGIDSDLFRPERRSEKTRERIGATEGRRLVLFAGRLAPEKGIDLLVKAYRHFSNPKRFVLAVLGHGPLEKRLQPFFDSHPEIRRLPYCRSREETAELLASADLVLSLGMRETFSLVTLEAMACGTPVLAGGSGGAGELVAQAGILQPFDRTAEGLARALTEGLDAKTADVSRQLSAFAHQRFDWERSFDRITSCYEKVHRAYESGDLTALESSETS